MWKETDRIHYWDIWAVLFVGGENDLVIDVPQSLERLSRLVPTAEIHLRTDCGHVVSNSVEYIIPFLLHSTAP